MNNVYNPNEPNNSSDVNLLFAIQTYNILLTVILFTIFMKQYQPKTDILVDIFLGIIISIIIFKLNSIPILNILLSLLYAGIWTYLTYIFFDKNIAWFHDIYQKSWKYFFFALPFIPFALLHYYGLYALDCDPLPFFPKHALSKSDYPILITQLQKQMDAQSNEIQDLKNKNTDLIRQNQQLLQEQHDLRQQNLQLLQEQHDLTAKSDTSTETSQLNNTQDIITKADKYTDYDKGHMSKSKGMYGIFDNQWEEKLDEILNELCKKYNLGRYFGIRVLAQQPFSNYVLQLDEDNLDKGERNRIINNKNRWTRFDFVFEIRKSHFPLLVIELDGPRHKTDTKQIERDEYKNGACDALDIPLLRIEYDGNTLPEDDLLDTYEKMIIKHIFHSLLKKDYTKKQLLEKYSKDTISDQFARECIYD